MSKIGHVYDPRYLLHETGMQHPERPARLQAIEEMIAKTQLKDQLRPIPARLAKATEIALVHDPKYIEAVARTSEKSGVYLDGDTFAGPESYATALLAAGGVLEAVDRVMDQDCDKAFAMVRPPGHHAESRYAMGFCIFNNIGVAAEYLVRTHGIKRVAVMDFDVHHGNATQHMFYDREDIFYLSTHRYPFYPGTGAKDERGTGAGMGYTLNVPMAAGGGDEEFQMAFDTQVLPALNAYRPEFLLVSAGFDAHELDPLGGMKVTDHGFRTMAKGLKEVANKYCQGRAVFVLEGGYDLKGLAGGVREVLEELVE